MVTSWTLPRPRSPGALRDPLMGMQPCGAHGSACTAPFPAGFPCSFILFSIVTATSLISFPTAVRDKAGGKQLNFQVHLLELQQCCLLTAVTVREPWNGLSWKDPKVHPIPSPHGQGHLPLTQAAPTWPWPLLWAKL